MDRLFAELLKFKACLKAFETLKPSVLPSIMIQIWPLLESLFSKFVDVEPVVEMLCDVVQCIVLSAGDEYMGEKYILTLCAVYSRRQYGCITESIGFIIRKSINVIHG